MRAALRLFASKGYGAVGIREIALEAQVSTAALYHYMRTKEDLLLALMRDRMDRMIAVGRIASDEFDDPERQLVALVRVHIITHARFPDGVIDAEVRSLSPEARPGIVALRDEYEACWDAVLDAGLARDLFDVPQAKLARLALLEMCNGVIHWYRPRGDTRLNDIADAYAEMALALVRARRGNRSRRLADLRAPSSDHYAHLVSRVFTGTTQLD